MKTSITRAALVLGLVTICFANSSQAASGLSFDEQSLRGAEYDAAGIFITGDVLYVADTDDGGGFDQITIRVFDDQVLQFQKTFDLAVGSSGSFRFELFYQGSIVASAPGVGLVLDDIPDSVFDDAIDNFIPRRYADPSECRIDCGPVSPVPEPSEYALMLMGLGVVAWASRRRSGAAV